MAHLKYLAFITYLVILSACSAATDSGIDNNNTKLLLDLDDSGTVTTKVEIHLKDKSTGEYIKDMLIRLSDDNNSFIAPEPDSVYIDHTRVKDGVLILNVKGDITPSEAQPVHFLFHSHEPAVADYQYLPFRSGVFTITQPGTHVYEVKLEKYQAPGSWYTYSDTSVDYQHYHAIMSHRDILTITDGLVPATLTLTSPVSTNIASIDTKITIPAGTVLYDAQNNPLQGKVTATIGFFNHSFYGNDDGLRGKISTLYQQADGSSVEADNGYLVLEIVDENENKARSFSQPIDLELSIPDTAFSELGGTLNLTQGDRVSLRFSTIQSSSYTLGAPVNKLFKAQFQLSQLEEEEVSYYLPDPIYFDLVINGYALDNFLIKGFDNDGGSTSQLSYASWTYDGMFTYYFRPFLNNNCTTKAILNKKFEVWYNKIKVGEKIVDICSTGSSSTIYIDVDSSLITPTSVELSIRANTIECTTVKLQPPNGNLHIKRWDMEFYDRLSLIRSHQDGSLSTQTDIIPGGSYTISGHFSALILDKPLTFYLGETVIDIPADFDGTEQVLDLSSLCTAIEG